jgi:hypothetical protein
MTTLIEKTPRTTTLPATHQDASKCTIFEASQLPTLTPMPMPSITPQQETAISLLVAGRPLGAVAHALRINRSTLFRWRHHDPVFQAELTRRQRDVCDTAEARLRLILLKATAMLEKGLTSNQLYLENRVNLALRLLTSVSVRTLCAPPETDARAAMEAVIRQCRASAGQSAAEIAAPIRAEEWQALTEHITASAQHIEALPESSPARWRGAPAVEQTPIDPQ